MTTCRSRRTDDQMICGQCGLAWDINDPEPPSCRMAVTPAEFLGKLAE